MRRLVILTAALACVLSLGAAHPRAQRIDVIAVIPEGTNYSVTFPAPEHHWLQVGMTIFNPGAASLDIKMSRSSPGRYAVSEFAKNVFSVEARDEANRPLSYSRPDPDTWRIASGAANRIEVVYKIFGDYASGTYFGVDTTHAHLQMPAVFMWVPGRESKPVQIKFSPPAGSNWKVATQLFPTTDPFGFTAPNLQYFMDSPTELADQLFSTFTVPNSDGTQANIRLAVHSDGSQADVDELARMVKRLVEEQMAVFGEYPKYEPGAYTFLLDYVPWNVGDGMEHRNSTSISEPGTTLQTPQGRLGALDTISHEYFHNWNVERIRPVGLEPFDFTRENVTCCLWMAEGFTQYYGDLLLVRAGFSNQPPVSAAASVINTPGRAVRSPVQMSEYAPFADGAGTFVDATDGSRTFLSYYTYGAGIALALDLSIREISAGKLTLDDYMRLLWVQHGKPGGPAPGLVGKPYSVKDLRDHLATLTANRKFADEFFDRYVEGREAPDYARLLALVGYTVPMAPRGRGWIGGVVVSEGPAGLIVGGSGGRGGRPTPVPFNTPVYDAGIDVGDMIVTIDGQRATAMLWAGLVTRRPGDSVSVTVTRRGGATVTKTIVVKQDPTVQQPVPVESSGGTLTPAQKAMRDAWLGSRVR